MSDTKHSPLPWKITHEYDTHIRDAQGNSLFCDMQYYPWCSDNFADWELIVRCVNSHERLVEALRELLEKDCPNKQYINGHPSAAKARALLAELGGAA